MQALIENLVRITGAAGVLTEPSEVNAFATDCRGLLNPAKVIPQ